MRFTIPQAHQLVAGVMAALGHDAADAGLIADHLIDCELRGLAYGGMARALSIAERMERRGDHRRPIRCLHETPVSARLDGGDHIGYVVAHRATTIAIEKAEASGIAVVGASDTWYTGMLSYYAEMAAARGLVSVIASNASPWVAPHGATEGRIGTNPICFGFPSADQPIILDIGTSAIIHAEVTLASPGPSAPREGRVRRRRSAHARSSRCSGGRIRHLGRPQRIWPRHRGAAARYSGRLPAHSA